MTPDRYEKIVEVFHAARGLGDDARRLLLDERCTDDKDLRKEVEKMLAADKLAHEGGFLDPKKARLADLAGEALGDGLHAPAPDRIAGYSILRRVGAGGMGIVYEAEQASPRRRVAIKVLRFAIGGREARQRFEREVAIAGRLNHPGLASIHEAGHFRAGEEDLPYFTMEYVDGTRIDEYCAQKSLPTRGRAELLAKVCDAVGHAHAAGVVHRDLKPGNILVRSGDAQPKVLDFGVARAGDQDPHATLVTGTRQVIGTLTYIAPEQLDAGGGRPVDARADVYSLGVILFEVLSGTLPFAEPSSVAEAVRVHREEEPTRLGAHDHRLRGDLENIVAKALDHDPARRYTDASELGADLRRYLEQRPVVARRASTWYQARKFAARNRALTTAFAALLLVLAAGATVSTVAAVGQARAREKAERQTRIAGAINTFFNRDLLGAASPLRSKGKDVLVRDMVDEAARRIGGGSLNDQPAEVEAAVRLSMGETYRALAMVPEAEANLRRSLSLFDGLGTPTPSAEHVDALRTLAGLLTDKRAMDEADGMYQRSLVAARACHGAESQEVASLTSDYAVMLKYKGDYARATDAYMEALRLTVLRSGETSPAAATILHNLAGVQANLGKLEDADASYARALALRRVLLAPDAPELGMTLTMSASVREDLGHTDDALARLDEARSILERAFGPDHPMIATVHSRRASVLRTLKRYDESLDANRAAAGIYAAKLGPEHPFVAVAVAGLGAAHAGAGRFDDAIKEYRRALAIDRKSLTPGHEQTVADLITLGELLLDHGDRAEGEALIREGDAAAREPGFANPVMARRAALAAERVDAKER